MYNKTPISTECNTIIRPLSILYFLCAEKKVVGVGKEQIFTGQHNIIVIFFEDFLDESPVSKKQRTIELR